MTQLLKTSAGVRFARQSDAAFKGLADYPWEPNYIEFEGLRLHYIDAGPRDGPVAGGASRPTTSASAGPTR